MAELAFFKRPCDAESFVDCTWAEVFFAGGLTELRERPNVLLMGFTVGRFGIELARGPIMSRFMAEACGVALPAVFVATLPFKCEFILSLEWSFILL